MVEKSDRFPHIQLKLARAGIANPPPSFSRSKNPLSTDNLNNRQGHGVKLKRSVESLILDWQNIIEKRNKEEQPTLPNAQRLILQIDPSSFAPEGLKSYGIEIIAELEDGFIIGASADRELSDLQKKIEKFIQEQEGANKVAEIWEIFDGRQKPEYILSPELSEQWGKIQDDENYTVDVGIACVGIESKLPKCPEKKTHETIDRYKKRLKNWMNKRDMTYEEWDDLKLQREDEFTVFVEDYQGEIVNIVDSQISKYAELPDSFSCRIKISGQGLKDLVLNFPYIFDVSLPEQIAELTEELTLSDTETSTFQLDPPDFQAPKVCVIDSGIQENHVLLAAAIDFNSSRSWVPHPTGQTSDQVKNGGHGTRVAGGILYPQNIPNQGHQEAVCWIQNARVLDADCKLDQQLFPPILLEDIVEFYHNQTKTRIFNHSITGSVPCRTQYMSSWASAIDNLTWKKDILFIVAAGNLPLDNNIGYTRLSVKTHLNHKNYPDYLLQDSCRIANPAQSFQALTVGSIALNSYHDPPYSSIAEKDKPSAFSCTGLGIWETIKPEIVEYGGDLVIDANHPPNITHPPQVCSQLVRSTLFGGPGVASDMVGTSFATPKVSHIAAHLAAELPNDSCLLYRALIVQSARWPEWTNSVDKLQVLRQIGYGIPDLDRALGNSPNRITLITQGECLIKARQAQVYQVKLPEDLRSQGQELDILLEVTLSYKAQPRRTRRNRRKYLSTWLDWECSKKAEDPESFLTRVLKEYDSPENSDRGEGLFRWTLGKQNNYGIMRNVSRSAGTLQKDWTIIKSFELTEAFCIAVVGHEGWDNNPDTYAPYSLVVSFEAIQANIQIYNVLAEAQVEIEIEQEIKV